MTLSYQALDVIDLGLYDYDLAGLYQRLLSVRKDHYHPHEKIVFEHYDLDFYYHGHVVGFTIHNVMTMLSRLCISPSVVVFITTHANLAQALETFIAHPNDRPTVLVTLVSRAYRVQFDFDVGGIIGTARDIKYHSMCLLGRPRAHKNLLAKYMLANGMTDRIEINYNTSTPRVSRSSIDYLDQVCRYQELTEIGLVYSMPHRSAETWMVPIKNQLIDELDGVTLPPQLQSRVMPASANPARDDFTFYGNFAMNVVVEPAFDNSQRFCISEKTLRSIWTETPFIILGAPGLLQHLRCFGMETFDDYWDESYDDITDPQERFAKFCQTLHSIYIQPLDQMKSVYQELRPRLERNRLRLQHYLDNDYKSIYNRYGIDHHATPQPLNR